MCEQLPDTATCVVSESDCWLPGRDTRLSLRPGPRETNASTLPLVSPGTRFDASERKATHLGFARNAPSTAGAKERPFAGWPPRPLEASCVLLPTQGWPA